MQQFLQCRNIDIVTTNVHKVSCALTLCFSFWCDFCIMKSLIFLESPNICKNQINLGLPGGFRIAVLMKYSSMINIKLKWQSGLKFIIHKLHYSLLMIKLKIANISGKDQRPLMINNRKTMSQHSINQMVLCDENYELFYDTPAAGAEPPAHKTCTAGAMNDIHIFFKVLKCFKILSCITKHLNYRLGPWRRTL